MEFAYDKDTARPCYTDMLDGAGSLLDGHYFIQDIEMARRIIRANPENHYDIGSRVDGFIAHVLSAGIQLTMIDIRPLGYDIDGLNFVQGDGMRLDGIADGSIESLSILHALEHFGLGRYGDSIDVDGWRKALHAIQRVMKSGGILYLSVPVGRKALLCFNGHRIFTPDLIINELNQMELDSFEYIRDYKVYQCDVSKATAVLRDYECGLFVFKKK